MQAAERAILRDGVAIGLAVGVIGASFGVVVAFFMARACCSAHAELRARRFAALRFESNGACRLLDRDLCCARTPRKDEAGRWARHVSKPATDYLVETLSGFFSPSLVFAAESVDAGF